MSINQTQLNGPEFGATAFTSALFWWQWGVIFSSVAVIAIAFGKEIYDYLHSDKHTPELMDALVTIAGGLLVLIPVYLERL